MNSSSGIPPLCLEFLCYLSVRVGVGLRGSYLIPLSVFTQRKSSSPLSHRPAASPRFRLDWGCQTVQGIGCSDLTAPRSLTCTLSLCRQCLLASLGYLLLVLAYLSVLSLSLSLPLSPSLCLPQIGPELRLQRHPLPWWVLSSRWLLHRGEM